MASRKSEDHGDKNLYDVLELSRKSRKTLSEQEIKSAYRKALLKWHPDKNQDAPSDTPSGRKETVSGAPVVTVDEITRAYEVLSDSKQKRKYDESLNKKTTARATTNRQRTTELEVVDLDDMFFDDKNARWYKACRCGKKDGFRISEGEMEQLVQEEEGDRGEVMVACEDCSHHIKILFAVEVESGSESETKTRVKTQGSVQAESSWRFNFGFGLGALGISFGRGS